METKDIANALKLTAQLSELHGENKFKIRTLSNAAFRLDKTNIDFTDKSEEEIAAIEGIGKSTAKKITELNSTGKLEQLENLLDKTPTGVIELLNVKGIGPKKVAQLWKELEIESPGELLYACNENRLVDLKGFGSKTQQSVKSALEFNQANTNKFHYAAIEKSVLDLVKDIKIQARSQMVEATGSFRRKCEIIQKVEILVCANTDSPIDATINEGPEVQLIYCSANEYVARLFETTATADHLKKLGAPATIPSFKSEEEIYKSFACDYIEPELREGRSEVDLAKKNDLPSLIRLEDLKGILHNHSTYSDGVDSLETMATYCKELGYEYLGICDHSKSAFYANGLNEERVQQQHEEIESLNEKLAPFKIFKGIESDILNNGDLDYSDEVLSSFDFIVASIHSNLKMDEDKATARLLKAIENPYTTILGHPTGRLLLSRPGYPINHKKVIDACAANGVAMELNSHPYRLDIDWRWIEYCIEKGVKISINPDAHRKEGYHDMYYGVCVARKGMLTKDMCFNALDANELNEHFLSRKK